jgi:hypothetical protein
MQLRPLLPAVALLAMLCSGGARADEPEVRLKDALGHDLVEANCGACHSLDYIRINAPFMTGKIWEAEVAKMINVFGAPIDAAEARTIVEYLTRNYGNPG